MSMVRMTGCLALCGALAVPASALQIVRGPYLQQVTQTGITVMWQTDQPSESAVDYGPEAAYGSTIAAAEPVAIHKIKLTGLQPDTAYHYRVRSGDTASMDAVFHSAVRPGTPFRFAVYGDNQSHPESHRRVVEGIISAKPRIVINVGDVVADGNVYEEWQRQFFGPAADLMREVPVYVAIGGHEGDSHWFYDLTAYPAPGDYYSFDYGSAHFTIVDTDKDYQADSPQYRWLEADLASDAAQKADWLLVAFHEPGYTEGWDDVAYDGTEAVREHLMPLLEKYGVDMVFNGHTHGYERGFYRGVYYVISGGGGGTLDHFVRGFEHVVISRYVYHYCTVDIAGPVLTLQAITPEGEMIDRLVVRKRPWRA